MAATYLPRPTLSHLPPQWYGDTARSSREGPTVLPSLLSAQSTPQELSLIEPSILHHPRYSGAPACHASWFLLMGQQVVSHTPIHLLSDSRYLLPLCTAEAAILS